MRHTMQILLRDPDAMPRPITYPSSLAALSSPPLEALALIRVRGTRSLSRSLWICAPVSSKDIMYKATDDPCAQARLSCLAMSQNELERCT